MASKEAEPQTPRRQCKATTKKGALCKAAPQGDRDVCIAHDMERRASTGFGGSEAGSKGGRPRKPRAADVLQARIEQDIDRWLKPLEDGLQAERGVVVGDGPSARVEFVPDMATRLKSVQVAFDRVYGKPTQPLDHNPDTDVDSEIERLLREMAERERVKADG